MKIVILLMLAASFAGFWFQRQVHKPSHQSLIASIYLIVAVAVVFGGIIS